MRILFIEDDAIMQLQFGDFLKRFGKVTFASNKAEAEEILEQQYFEIAFIDLDLGEDKLIGLELLEKAKKKVQSRYLLTSHDDDSIIKRAFENKATGFFTKNVDYHQLKQEVEFVLIETQWDQNQNLFFKQFPTANQTLKQQIEQLIKSPSLLSLNLYLSGETGVGKTFLVKALCKTLFPHKKLFNLNLSEIPVNLLESELFGHAEGSFTGAIKSRIGLLEEANNQIIFLDEIATLPIEIQGRLLKVLEEKRFKPVGSNQEVRSEFLLITASCEDLQEKIKNGSFREDFFYRLNGHHLHIPSLRERKEDIPLIAKAWMATSPRKVDFSKALLESLKSKKWPGNTRELIYHLKKVCYLGKSHFIDQNSELALIGSEVVSTKADEIEKLGLQGYLAKLERHIFKTYAQKHHYKVNQICRELKLSKAVYYRLARS